MRNVTPSRSSGLPARSSGMMSTWTFIDQAFAISASLKTSCCVQMLTLELACSVHALHSALKDQSKSSLRPHIRGAYQWICQSQVGHQTITLAAGHET